MRLRLLLRRWRGAPGLLALRLCGLVLAALLAAAVPVFVAGAMEQVLHKTLAAANTTAAVISWTASDETETTDLSRLTEYLKELGTVAHLPSTGPLGAQAFDDKGKLLAGKKYYRLAPLPAGTAPTEGRLPKAGEPEVLAPAKSGYTVGTRLRLPLEIPVEVTVVGVSPAHEGALLADPAYWTALRPDVGEAVWTVTFPASRLHAAGAPALAAALA
ncbi:MAG TPA: hypothetical protein VNT75_33065, partial [Symbiobacteriaceae bacterium]|nr:hypothetical protein [Symbiobacteriaceae bacterium]